LLDVQRCAGNSAAVAVVAADTRETPAPVIQRSATMDLRLWNTTARPSDTYELGIGALTDDIVGHACVDVTELQGAKRKVLIGFWPEFGPATTAGTYAEHSAKPWSQAVAFRGTRAAAGAAAVRQPGGGRCGRRHGAGDARPTRPSAEAGPVKTGPEGGADMRGCGRWWTVLIVGQAAAGCGMVPGIASPAGPGPAGPAAEDASVPREATCAIDAADLSAATGMTWQLSATLTDHPLETMESVLATACLYTADDQRNEYGDPLTLRVDVVDGDDAVAVRNKFEESCTGNGGTVTPSASAEGAAICDRDGSAQEGNVSSGGTSVDVYYSGVPRSLLSEVTSSFEQVLGTVRM